MSRKKKPLPLLENVTIEACAAEGKSLFHWGELVVFVPFCVPGDVVHVQIRRKKHSFAEGEVARFIQYSNVRATPRCQHFGVCGGCKWQNLPYEAQLQMKQQQVYDQLTRMGHLSLPKPGTADDGGLEFRPIMGSVRQYEYRNKLDFGASNRRWLTKEEIGSGAEYDRNAIGFHITGAFDKILPIERCHLMDDLHNHIRNEVFHYAVGHGLSFFDLRQQTGMLRDVIIRNSNSGEWMVIVQFHFDRDENGQLTTAPTDEREAGSENRGAMSGVQQEKEAMLLLQHLADKFPQISSLLYLDNQKCNDTIGDQEILLFKGNDHIFEQMEDLRFKVGPKSFYQTNTEQAYHLYSVVRELMELPVPSPQEGKASKVSAIAEGEKTIEAPSGAVGGALPLVYDLYTGTGTIANFVARRARQVVGIEYVPEAIEDAKVNSQVNGIDNTLFYAGDMKDILTDDFIARHGRPDIIITDPPRAGMHPDVVQTILQAAPERIVYVSCNPATQARDLQLLCQHYRLCVVQPVDMFPHTPHVENVVLLVRNVSPSPTSL